MLFLFGAVSAAFSQGSLCEDPIVIGGLPFSVTDDTANYANNYQGAPGSSCGSYFTSFLYGNDVVYAYTASFNGSINLYLSTPVYDSVGLFVYSSCTAIGDSCITGVTNLDVSGDTIAIEALPVENGTTYYFVVSTAFIETAYFTLNIMENTCLNATATYTVMSDCSVAEEFSVVVDVTSLGSAESIGISDSYGLPNQTISEAGAVTFGPYTNGTEVTYTLVNQQDGNCFLTSSPQTSLICAPVNDFCVNAIDLGSQLSPIDGTTYGATNQNVPFCASYGRAGDVYYKIDVPNNYTLTIGLTGTDYDAVVSAFVGSCADNSVLMCEDNDTATYTFFNDIGYTRTLYWVVDGYNGVYGNYTLSWSMSDCVIPQAVFTVVPDCSEGEYFLVNADIFTLGSADSVTITDNQGGAPQTITEVGQLQLGPYANTTQVSYTIVNDGDATCSFTSEPMTQETCPLTCAPATYYHTVELICPDPGYMVTLHMTGLGTAAAVTITDDQGSPSQTAVIGAYQFGPYEPYMPVNFSIVNDDNPACYSTLQAISYTVCPPANDSCTNPIALLPGGDFETGAVLATNEGATLSPELPYPTCGNMFFNQAGKDVWYTVTVPPSGNITIETAASGSSDTPQVTDSVLQVYVGDCANLIEYGCDDESGDGSYSIISFSNMNPNDLLFIRAFAKYGGQGAFKISAYDASLLSIPSIDIKDLISYPNPVKNVLNFSSHATITDITVFNLLGQQVTTKISETGSSIDMSDLPDGTYLVKVKTENEVKSLKIIKE